MTNETSPVLSASLDSQNLSEAEYDPFMRVLTLRFKKGGVYEYIDVDKSVFEELQEASSAGRYFHSSIKGKFEFLKRAVPEK